MHNIELTTEEMEVLKSLLRHSIDEMDVEMGHTATREFKALLKHRREMIEKVLEKLSEQVPA